MIEAGTVLPKCRICGERVQFARFISGEAMRADRDLDGDDKAA
jgi:hypothetical protein